MCCCLFWLIRYFSGTNQVKYYNYCRIRQNMSQFNLSEESSFRIPDLPNLNHTLLLIQTQKYLPATYTLSHHVTPQPLSSDEDISLQLDLQKISNCEAQCQKPKKRKNGCTCKKTKCLKLYCECFSAGKMCTADCQCHDCYNNDKHKDCIKQAMDILQKTTSKKQAKHFGCTCKKSQCQKKYCQCFNAGVPCGQWCKCVNCANGTCSSHSSEHQHNAHHIIQLIPSISSMLI